MNFLMSAALLCTNIAHGLCYLHLSTRNPFRFLALFLASPFVMTTGVWLGEMFPAANGLIMPAFLVVCVWLHRALVTRDRYSRIFFNTACVIACAQVLRTPPMLAMVFWLGMPPVEASRIAHFIYPVTLLLLAPVLFRYVREPFRRILDIVETQKWYLVCLPPVILTSIGDIAHFPAEGMTPEAKLSGIGVILPVCIVAYFISLYLFLINYRDKELLRQQLGAAGRLEHAYEFYGRELGERENRLRTLRHDFRHHALHLAALARAGDFSELTRELDKIAKTGSDTTVTPFSENRTVNAVVFYHFARAAEKGVHCVAKAFVPEDLPVKEADLSLLLGNALENCVKGAGPLGDRGYITFSARPVRGYMAFTFENNYEPGGYATGEQAGLASIRRICERLNGRMEVTDAGGKFTLRAFVAMV